MCHELGKLVRDDVVAATPDLFFIRFELRIASATPTHGIMIIDSSVASMHAKLDESIYAKAPNDIHGGKYWKPKAAPNGTMKASQP